MTETPAPLVRVFISHAGFDGVVGDLVDALEAALTPQAGFEVLIDRDGIPLGTRFRGKVEEFIADCDAAVVLVSRSALDPQRPWVRTEAAKLGSKAFADKTFQLVPVFLEGVNAARLRQDEWDAVQLAEPNAVTGGEPAEMAEQIRDGLGATLRRLTAGAVERGLAMDLRKLPDRTLMDAAQVLMVGAPITAGDPPSTVARRLLAGPLTAKTAVDFVRGWLLTDSDIAIRVLRVVLPYTWVDAEAAASVAAAARGRRPIGLNTALPVTSHAYVARASQVWPPAPTYDVISGGEDLDEIRREVARVIADVLGEPEVEDLADIPVDALQPDDPIFVAVPCPYFDAEVVQALDGLPAGVVVVLLGGAAAWADADVPAAVEYITPELDEEAERRAHTEVRRAKQKIRNLMAAGGLAAAQELDL